MKKVRLILLQLGFAIGVVGLFIGTPKNAPTTTFPKPFGLNYNIFLPIVGFGMFTLSMFSSWWVDEMNDTEKDEVGTVILKSTLLFFGNLILSMILGIFLGELFDND